LPPVQGIVSSSRCECKSHKNPSYLHGGKCGAVTPAALYMYVFIHTYINMCVYMGGGVGVCWRPRRTSFTARHTLLEPAIGSHVIR
jgi:hypothetical protein